MSVTSVTQHAKHMRHILQVYTKEWCGFPLFTIATAPFFCVYPVYSYTSIPPLGLHCMFWGEIYFFWGGGEISSKSCVIQVAEERNSTICVLAKLVRFNTQQDTSRTVPGSPCWDKRKLWINTLNQRCPTFMTKGHNCYCGLVFGAQVSLSQ